jgi:hypothetical protein
MVLAFVLLKWTLFQYTDSWFCTLSMCTLSAVNGNAVRIFASHVGAFLSLQMRGSGIRFTDVRLYVRFLIWYYYRRHSGLMNLTALWLTAEVPADTVLSQATQYGPYCRNHQIDAPNGSALMEDVTGGALTVAACGHWAQAANDINPSSMEQRFSWGVDSLSGGRLLVISNSVTLPTTAFHLSLTMPHESNPYLTQKLIFIIMNTTNKMQLYRLTYYS